MNTPLGDFAIRPLSAPPTTCPITLDQAKNSLSVPLDFDELDDMISGFILAARQYLEQNYNCLCQAQQVEMTLQQFPRADRIRIPLWPIQSIDYFRFVSNSGAVTEWNPATQIRFRQWKKPAEIILPFGGTWPGLTLDTADGIQIGMTAGYVSGASPELLPLPEGFRWAMKLLLGHMYENRSAATIGTLSKSDPLILSVDAYMADIGLVVVA